MSTFDLVLLIVLGGFTVSGLFKGIIKILGHFVGLIVGTYVASHFYLNLYAWGEHLVGDHANAGKVAAFIILFVVAARLTRFLFVLIEKLFKFIAVIPGSKYINNLLGAVLGFLEGALILGLIIYVISRYSLIGNFFGDQLTASAIAPFLLRIVKIILPLLPDALKTLQAII
ncbi:TPA: hypothetical protein DCZ15_00985 [Candidatus Falkowbacteria bacterium]|nr:MAG: Colicin V production protein [Candidatus Falkowbacteria bacterium GW2011_GWF2_43_32]HBA36430.1 hypothetical protein [Candidatus Falkowbacteria bacterium]